MYMSRNKCSNNNAIEAFLINLDIPKLTDEKKDLCEVKVRFIRRSVKVSLILFRIIKPLGSDGIPIKFYKRCWPLIEEPLINGINECFEKGELAGSQKQAVITLNEKKANTISFFTSKCRC